MPRALPYKSGDVYSENILLTGKAFYRATPTERANVVEAICFCGKLFYTRLSALKSGHSTSCGCRRVSSLIKTNTKHGICVGESDKSKKRHPIYNSWTGAKSRCFGITSESYKSHGARGITMCSGWKNSFLDFYKWAIENGWSKGLSIDRIDNEGHYSCGKCAECVEKNWTMNCRWTTLAVQMSNTRVTKRIEAFGEIKSQAEWERDERVKVSVRTFSQRILNGWKAEEAMTLKIRL